MIKPKINIPLICIAIVLTTLFAQCDIGKKKALQQVADQMNELAPLKMDQYTVLINAEVQADDVLQYNYRLLSNTEAITSPKNKRRIENTLLYNLSQGEDGKIVRELEATVVYSYTDAENKPVMELRFAPKEYLGFRFDESHLGQELHDMVGSEQEALPMIVNDKLTVLSMEIENNNTLVTTYILQGLTADEIQQVKQAVEETSLQDVKINPAMTLLRAMKGKFRYVYKNEKDAELFVVEIAPGDY